jgi:hypothetical protein
MNFIGSPRSVWWLVLGLIVHVVILKWLCELAKPVAEGSLVAGQCRITTSGRLKVAAGGPVT